MRKWWLERHFKDEQGRHILFRGWINTRALREEDFPDILEGKFWAESVKTKENKLSMMGFYDIGFGEKDQDHFVFGHVYPLYYVEGLDSFGKRTRENETNVLKAQEPVEFKRFEASLEDCIQPQFAYVDTIFMASST